MSQVKRSRAEQTREAILHAARKLFSENGYESVSMRTIAKQAGCSHTSIYVYFQDKEALLHELAMPVLQQLKSQLQHILDSKGISHEQKLKKISFELLKVGIGRRNMYDILFKVKAGRVDDVNPTLAINQLRNELFGILQHALHQCLPISSDNPLLLTFSRIYFYTLQGMIGTYDHSEEAAEQIIQRLGETFETGIDVLIAGFQQHVKKGGTEYED